MNGLTFQKEDKRTDENNILESLSRLKGKDYKKEYDLFVKKIKSHNCRRGSKIRRFWDILVGLPGFFYLLILYPIIALCIKLSSQGPVLKKQTRIGKGGEKFDLLKFRTTHLPHQVSSSENRFFPFGKFLRRYFLDELPILINLLKGDLSLMGPQSLPVSEALYWSTKFEEFLKVYTVKPGILCLSSINIDYNHIKYPALFKKILANDLIYVKRHSLKLDLKILFQSIFFVFTLKPINTDSFFDFKEEIEMVKELIIYEIDSKSKSIKKDLSEVKVISKKILQELDRV